jgi:hypothetical protein
MHVINIYWSMILLLFIYTTIIQALLQLAAICLAFHLIFFTFVIWWIISNNINTTRYLVLRAQTDTRTHKRDIINKNSNKDTDETDRQRHRHRRDTHRSDAETRHTHMHRQTNTRARTDRL